MNLRYLICLILVAAAMMALFQLIKASDWVFQFALAIVFARFYIKIFPSSVAELFKSEI